MLGRALECAASLLSSLRDPVDQYLEETSPTLIIAATLAAFFTVRSAYNTYRHWDTDKVKNSIIKKGVTFALWTPYLKTKLNNYIEKEVSGALDEIKKDVDIARRQYAAFPTLPETGVPEELILARLSELQHHYHEGKISGAVYTKHDEKFRLLLEKIWGKTELTNPMHSDWPLIHVMRAEIISWCQNLLHGQSGAHGVITHGGTTSIIEACLAYVSHARANGIEHPEIIVPETAHVSFDKAAHILNVTLVKIPVDKKSGKADVLAMEKAINSSTCMMVGSAPSFPYGIMDPIQHLAKVAQKHRVPLHVDSCLGGFLTAFAHKAGFILPPCDFSVKGVTSISFDTHKYGETPKGTSVLLFSPDCPATPTQAYLDWIGGLYVTDTMDGSRSGADIATTWATLAYKGEDYYIESTRRILTLQRELIAELKNIDGLFIAYDPELSVVGMKTAPGINPLLVAQKFKEKHWALNVMQRKEHRLFEIIPSPQVDGIHFCLTAVHTAWPEFKAEFVHDMAEAVAYAKANPHEKPKGMMKAYGKLEKGIPEFLQKRIGDGYAKIQNAISGVDIPGVWKAPAIGR